MTNLSSDCSINWRYKNITERFGCDISFSVKEINEVSSGNVIQINVSSNIILDKIEYRDNNQKWNFICKNCRGAPRIKHFV